MNEEILNNIWSTLSNDPNIELEAKDFEEWKNNFLTDPEVPGNVYRYLRENKLTDSSPKEWVKNISTSAPVEEVDIELPDVEAVADETRQPGIIVPEITGEVPELTAEELASYRDPEVDIRVTEEIAKGREAAEVAKPGVSTEQYFRRKRIEQKTDLNFNQYPDLIVGTEEQSYMGQVVDVPILEQADEDKMEEIIADASAEYRKEVEVMMSNQFELLQNMAAKPQNYEAQLDEFHNNIYSKLQGKYPGLEKRAFNHIIGKGTQRGLFNTTLQKVAAENRDIDDDQNIIGAATIKPEFLAKVDKMMEKTATEKELEKKRVNGELREKYKRLKELKKGDPDSTEIKTLLTEIATLESDKKKLATWIRTTTAGKFEEIDPLL